MDMRACLVLLVLLVGCGAAPERYAVDCLEIDSDVPLDVETVSRNVALARSLFATVAPPDEFCAAAGVPIHVVGADDLGGGRDGWYDRGGITLAAGMSALLHELLHSHDDRRGVEVTHDHWRATGFARVAFRFQVLSVPPYAARNEQ